MERIAVFVNDADHARQMLMPMIDAPLPTHWLLAACPPSLTRHAGRWLSHGARQAWALRWSADLFAQLAPLLREPPGSRVETMLVGRSVQGLAERLLRQHGPIRLLDARAGRGSATSTSRCPAPTQRPRRHSAGPRR